jgi:hypothetical protein
MSSNISYGSNPFDSAPDTGGLPAGGALAVAVVVSPTLALESCVFRLKPPLAAAGSVEDAAANASSASPISPIDPNDPLARGGGANMKSSNDAEFVRSRSRISDNGLISIMIFPAGAAHPALVSPASSSSELSALTPSFAYESRAMDAMTTFHASTSGRGPTARDHHPSVARAERRRRTRFVRLEPFGRPPPSLSRARDASPASSRT